MVTGDGTSAAAIVKAQFARAVDLLLQGLPAPPALPSAAQRDWALSLLDLTRHVPDLWPVARRLLLRLAPAMEQAGHRHEWVQALAWGRAQALAHDEPEHAAEFAYHLGLLHRLLAQHAVAYEYLTESAARFARLDLPQRQARAINQLAYLCRLMGRYAEARELAARALALTDDPVEQAYTYFVLGIVALDGCDWQATIQAYERSLALRQTLGDQRLLAWSYGNLGSALSSAQRYDEARGAYAQALSLYGAIHDPLQQAITEMNLANLHLLCHQPHQALAGYRRAEPVLRHAGDGWHLAAITLNIGMALRALGDWPAAHGTLLAAVEAWGRLGDRVNQADALGELAELYRLQQQPNQAVATLHQALAHLAQTPDDPRSHTLLVELSHRLQSLAPPSV